MVDDVSEVIDDLVQDTSDRFVVDRYGNFRSKSYKRSEDRAKFKNSKRKSKDLVTTLYDRDPNTYTQTPRDTRVRFAQEPSVETYEVDHDKPMRASGPRNSNGYEINRKRYQKRLRDSRDNVLTERMYYDESENTFDVNAPEVFSYDDADTIEKASDAKKQALSAFNTFQTFKAKYMSNKDNFYSLKMCRQHLDEAIGWMTILVESLNDLDDTVVIENLGDSKAYFTDHLLSFERTKQQIDKQFDSFFDGGKIIRSCLIKWVPLLSVTVVATFLSSGT